MLPQMVIMAPKDEAELRNMLYTAIEYKDGPIAIRYPRGSALGVEVKEDFEAIQIGKGEILLSGTDIAILAVGNMVRFAVEASNKLSEENINVEVINMRFIKPLDTELLDKIAEKFDKVITIEENSIVGGFGSGVLEYFADKGFRNNVLRLGLPDSYVEHGTQDQLYNLLKIDTDGIIENVKEHLSKK